tara:strand:- start:193 stop:324 length:132 start_codon:yes stop_codon:yes gene_type:complete
MIRVSKDMRVSCHNAKLEDILLESIKRLVQTIDDALMKKFNYE